MRAWGRCEQGNPNLGSEEIKGETLIPPAGGQETSSMSSHARVSYLCARGGIHTQQSDINQLLVIDSHLSGAMETLKAEPKTLFFLSRNLPRSLVTV